MVVTSKPLTSKSEGSFTLEDFLANPPTGMEWVDGNLVEKNGMTLRHGELQLRLGRYWENYAETSGQGGKTYTDAPCRTNKQGRKPDVAHLTPGLVAQFGNLAALPQSFPLIAEIVSPTDLAEELMLKAQEYLASGGLEVWLVFPESKLILIATQEGVQGFVSGQSVSTQVVLQGFTVPVDELLV